MEPSTPDTTLESQSTFTILKFKIPNFLSFDKTLQYYIDRYNNESSYKFWFDSNFPNTLIYNILGYIEPISIPNWIKNNTEWIPYSFISSPVMFLEN